MPVLSLACHLPHNTPHIPSRYNNEQTTKQTKAIKTHIYINISCKCDTNRAGHFTLDACASRPVACSHVASRHRTWESETANNNDISRLSTSRTPQNIICLVIVTEHVYMEQYDACYSSVNMVLLMAWCLLGMIMFIRSLGRSIYSVWRL